MPIYQCPHPARNVQVARCQALPQATWTPAADLWHFVFISHRWGSQDDPDPSGLQLATLQQLVLSRRVSTLVLRQEGDGYLKRGWCLAESMMAGAKEDVFKPMIVRTNRWDEPLALNLAGAYVAFQAEIVGMLEQWSNVENPVAVGTAFESAINATATLLLLNSDRSLSEFVVAVTGATVTEVGMFAAVQSRLALLRVEEQLDLAGELVVALQAQGLGCRDERDYVLVALLLLRSLTAVETTGEVDIWRETLARFTTGSGWCGRRVV